MRLGKWLQPLLLLLLHATGTAAFAHSCVEMQSYVGDAFKQSLTYICIVTQEGFTNWDQLKNIKITANTTVSYYDVANSGNHCMQKSAPTSWTVQSGKMTLDCDQEFTFMLSSELPEFIIPIQQIADYSFKGRKTLVVPQTGMWIRTKSCTGTGKVTVSTGVGVDTNEWRYDYRYWPCSSLPDWIISFDNVISIEVDATVEYTMSCSSDLGSEVNFSTGDSIIVITSGKSDDLQNLVGNDNRVRFRSADGGLYDVNVNMQLTFDSANTGAVGLQESNDGAIVYYYGGSHTAKFHSDFFEILYVPKDMQPSEISHNNDLLMIDISISGQAPPATKPASTTTSTKPATQVQTTKSATTATPISPASKDQFCDCNVDKFGFADGWNYNDIWVDIVFILDTSEALGQAALDDATVLIESFISDGTSDFLITNTTAELYSRIGVISMSDKAEVLYTLNMTKADSLQGKAVVKKGVSGINVIDAYNAAVSMFKDGLTKMPDRANTRQVIYYITDSEPNNDLSSLSTFKTEQGVIVVDNFLEDGEVERPRLRDLASDGYYFLSSNYMQGLQAFCKSNCFCKPGMDTFGGGDQALRASGGCYHPTTAGVPFIKAKVACANNGGIIATNHDEEKGRFLWQLMTQMSSKSDYFWIGYEKSDAGVWQWEDESTDPYTNWDVDEPSGAAVAKCAYIDTTNASLPWGAGNCQLGFPYVCQYTPCSAGSKNC